MTPTRPSSPVSGLTALAKGQWAEAQATSWLLTEGYEVFVGFGNTSCDLMALRSGRATRVEVKFGPITSDRQGHPAVLIPPSKPDNYDMLLVVAENGRVLVDPRRGLHVLR